MGTRTRDRILETAAQLFHEQGFGGTAVATILRQAGVNSGSLYHFFPSKEALLVEVLKWYQGRLAPDVMVPVEAVESDPIERIFVLLAWYRGNLEKTGCRLGSPIGNLALELSDTHPEVRPDIERNFDLWTARIESWLDAASHRLPASTDRRALARFVLTVMEGGVMQARTANELTPFDDSVAELRSYIDALLESAFQKEKS